MIKKLLAPLGAAILGAIGAVLRSRQLAGGFDTGGLPVSGFGITTALTVLSILVIAAAIALGLTFGKKGYELDFRHAFGYGIPGLAVRALCGALAAFGTIGLIPTMSAELWQIAFLALALLSGLGFIGLGAFTYLGRGDGLLMPASIIPAIFSAYWMALSYRDGAGDPVVLNYCFSCLAFAMAALHFSYCAGFAFGRPAPKAAFATGFAAVFFLVTILPESRSVFGRMIIAALALAALINLFSLAENTHKTSKHEAVY